MGSRRLDWRETTGLLLRRPELGLILVLALSTVIFTSINSAFISGPNVESNLQTASFIGLVAIGETFLIISGQFDLSVGSVAAFAAVAAAVLMAHHGVPVPLAILIAVLLGALAGLINGLLVVKAGLPALIITLGMLFAARGGTYVLGGGTQVYPLPSAATWFSHKYAGLPASVWIVFVLAVGADIVLRRSQYGRRVYATGGNARAAALAGIRVDRVQIAAFVLTGALSALAGVFAMAQLQSGDPQIGTGWELSVIAAVVVGGVSLRGGVGAVAVAVVGVVFLQAIQSGLVVSGVAAALQPVAVGLVMILALAVDRIRSPRYRT
jgi:ribose transport system permease protein